jgi:hypothetical protein
MPFDKSWIINMGFLDLMNGYDDIRKFLHEPSNNEKMGDDLFALSRVVDNWNTDKPLDVGESGKLFRCVTYYLWKKGISREITVRGTLVKRAEKICKNPDIVNQPIQDLLKLDNQTSQWASIAALMAKQRREDDFEGVPYKLRVTYQGIGHWIKCRQEGLCWKPWLDFTIGRQMKTFEERINGEASVYAVRHAEEYPFARVMRFMDPLGAAAMFPNLRGHESNRIEGLEDQIKMLDDSGKIYSKDHRVISALVMRRISEGKDVKILHPEKVSKAWPRFFDFMDYCIKKYGLKAGYATA